MKLNRYFWDTFNSVEQSIIPRLNVQSLPKAPKNYIKEIVGTIEAILGKGSIEDVVLFGSLSYDEVSDFSDVDLLVVVKESTKYSQIRNMEGILKSIEIKYGYAKFPNSIITKILRVVEKTTGMFCSHFVCTRQVWEQQNFARIFNTFRPFTWILAPEKVVLDSMKSGASSILQNGNGVDLSLKERPYTRLQAVKSMLMNIALFCGGLAMLPFGEKNMVYIMESFKWSLRTAYFIFFKKTGKLEKAIKIAKKIGLSPTMLRRFVAFRKNLSLDLMFVLKVPLHIIHLHLLVLKYFRSFRR